MCDSYVLKLPMRVRAGVIAFCCVSTALVASGQGAAATPKIAQVSALTTAPTCADLHLVPAVRECTAVAAIPIADLGFFVTAVNGAEDGFAAEDLTEQS